MSNESQCFVRSNIGASPSPSFIEMQKSHSPSTGSMIVSHPLLDALLVGESEPDLSS